MSFKLEEEVVDELEAILLFEEDKIENEVFEKLNKKGLFSGKEGEIVVYRDLEDKQRYVFVGLGKEKDLTLDKVRKIFFKFAKELEAKKEPEVKVYIPKLNGLCTKKTYGAAYEGILHAGYTYDRFKSKKEDEFELNVRFDIEEEKEEKVVAELLKIQNIMDGVYFTRDLVNLPSNYIYPETLANITKEELEKFGVKVKIYEEKEIKELGMEAYLSVARGSSNKPRLIVMEYMNNSESTEKVALVGKGVTYDTGGYSIKPNDGMKTMFCDMGGAGTVIGTMLALAKNNVKTNVDAEGRLTLADAVYYASTVLKADKIIDLATLTGACLVALSEYYTGSVTNNKELFKDILEASKEAGEPIWLLPTSDEFKQLNNSRVADIKNSGGRMGGTITAGLFIGEFVNNTPWVHLDIAGTAFLSKAYGYLPVGATGVHIKTLYNYLEGLK